MTLQERRSEDVGPPGFPGAGSSSSSANDVWDLAKERLRKKIGDDVFGSWFQRMELESLEDGTARLSVPTRFLKSWIQSHYAEKLLACMQAEKKDIVRIEITVRSAVLKNIAKTKEPSILRGADLRHRDDGFHETLGGAPLDSRLVFETFVVGSSNTLAHAAAKQIAAYKRNDTPMFNPLFIHANVGLGKTHLLQSVTQAVNGAGERKALYLTFEKFMYGFAPALRQNEVIFRERLRGVGVFLLDDLQFFTGRTCKEFHKMLSALLDAGKQVIVAADRPPSGLEQFDERVRTRLAAGLVVEMGNLNEDVRLTILKVRVAMAKAHHPGFDVTQPAMDYIAKNVTGNGRDLEGAINRLLAHSKLTGHFITMELVEREVRDLIRPPEAKRVKIEDIQRLVAHKYNVARTDLISSRRTADVVRPRQVAMYLAKILTLRSLPEIGRSFGGRDHTTVLHAVKKIEGLLGSDADLVADIETFKRQLLE